MSLRRSLIPLALLASAAALSCKDPSPTSLDLQTPDLLAARVKTSSGGNSNKTGLVVCSQSYDSASKVIGPMGDTLHVGNHVLWVDSLSLTDTVTITAVAPAASVRWVRFQPEGLVFKPGFYATVNGVNAGAALYTNYKDCGVPTTDSVRIAQVTDSLAILGYLQTWVQAKKIPWSQANQYVVGLLPHFSNYAVAW
ncbi:MAG TPA: hypothetical protein VEK86_04695 [Gemmatimonadales bacterium]|nr:hypothetical protein [Gemmatimonadales bacterium]